MLGARVKRQDTDEEELERQLCQGKGAGEWFRLETGKDKCRDVIQCTASVRKRSDSKEGRKEGMEGGTNRHHPQSLEKVSSSSSIS